MARAFGCLLLGYLLMPLYVRWNRNVYQFSDVPGDGRCLYHALGRSLGLSSNEGNMIRGVIASATRWNDSRYPSLFQAMVLYRCSRGQNWDVFTVCDVLEKFHREASEGSVGTVPRTRWGTDEHMLIYSLVTGNRVICIHPGPGGLVLAFDSLEVWNGMVQWGLMNGLTVPEHITLNVSSFCQHVYFHKAGHPLCNDVASFDHFAGLVPEIGIPGSLTHLPEIFFNDVPFFPIGPPTVGAGLASRRTYDKSRGDGDAPGGRTNRAKNKDKRRKLKEQKKASWKKKYDEAVVAFTDMGTGEDLCREQINSDSSDVSLVEEGRELPDLDEEMVRVNRKRTPILADDRQSKRCKTFWDTVEKFHGSGEKIESSLAFPVQNRLDGSREHRLEWPGCADFGVTPEELTNALSDTDKASSYFDTATKDPLRSVLLHYVNSGLFGFQRWKEYSARHAGKTMTSNEMAALSNEILDEELTVPELKSLAREMFECHSYVDNDLLACGCCGLREWQRPRKPVVEYKRVRLGEDLSLPMRYSSDEINEFNYFKERCGNVQIPTSARGDFRKVELWRARSMYLHVDNVPWHVHPELVEFDDLIKEATTLVCPYCHDSLAKGERPARSIAVGTDMGHYKRLGLTLPNLHEQMILSRSRMFFAAIKLTSNRKGQVNFNVTNMFKCHAVLFPSDEAETLNEMTNSALFDDKGLLDEAYLRHLLSIACVDDKTEPDSLMNFILGSSEILGRPWVISQWIIVLRHINEYYKDLKVDNVVEFTELVKKVVEKNNENIAKNVSVIDDPSALLHEQSLGSDTTENQQMEVREENEEVEPGTSKQTMRYSYVTRSENGYYVESRQDCRLAALRRMTEDHLSKEKGLIVDMEALSGQNSGFSPQASVAGEASSVGSDVVSICESYAQLWEDAREGKQDEISVCTVYSDDSLFEQKVVDDDAISLFDSCMSQSSQRLDSSGTLDDTSGLEIDSCLDSDAEDEAPYPSFGNETWPEDKVTLTGTSKREKEPMKPFTENFDRNRELCTTFPHVFLLGNAYGKLPGRMNHRDRYHLLNQFTLTGAKDRRLIAYLFDMKQRMAVMDGVKAYVNGSRKSLDTIESLLNDRDKRKELSEACRDPESSEAKQVLNRYMPHFRFASSNVAYGAAEGNKFQWRAVEMNKRFSSPNCFLTISPTTIDNVRSLRLAFHTRNNRVFPAVFEQDCPYGANGRDFIDKLRDNSHVLSEGRIQLPEGVITKSMRAGYAMDNPVAYVQENKTLLNDIMSILLGFNVEDEGYFTRTESNSERSTYYYKQKKGIFGHPLYAIGVTENHSRGTLHWHISLLAGLSPHVLQRFANLRPVCQHISKVLDSMYTSDIPEEVHVGHLLRQAIKKRRNDPNWRITTGVTSSISSTEPLLFKNDMLAMLPLEKSDREFKDAFKSTAVLFASYKQHHQHCSTCHKTVRGILGCRFDYPCGVCEKTRGVKLRPAPGYCMPCSSVSDRADKSYVVDDSQPEREYKHGDINVLSKRKADDLNVWEIKHPTIIPSTLPSESNGLTPTRQELQLAFIKAVKNLPNFSSLSARKFQYWLRKKATDEQVLQLWREIIRDLPGANRLVPSFNPMLSFCTGSHNHAALLGSLQQAKSALFYLVPYQGKGKFPIAEAVPILNNALRYVDKNPSEHPTETGMMSRTIKHVLTRTLNKLHLRMEISDYEMAASLLDLPSVISSERFSVGNVLALGVVGRELKKAKTNNSTIDGFQKLCEKIKNAKTIHKHRSAGILGRYKDWVSIGLRSESEDEEEDEEDDSFASNKKSIGGSHDSEKQEAEDLLSDYGFLRKINVKEEAATVPLLIPEVSLYLHRSEQLEHLNYYEYLACVEARSGGAVSSSKKKTKCGKFPLLASFPGSAGVHHVLLQKQKTPLLIGHAPPHPGEKPDRTSDDTGRAAACWSEAADRYARYHLALFRPHRVEDDESNWNWTALENYVEHLRTDNNMISKFRLMVMDQHMVGLRVPYIHNKMSREYRGRNRHLWSGDEKQKNREKMSRRKKMRHEAEDPFSEHFTEGSEELSDTQNANMISQLIHECKQNQQMSTIFADQQESRQLSSSSVQLCRNRNSAVLNCIKELRQYSSSHASVIDSEDWWESQRNRNTAALKISSLREQLVINCPSTGRVKNNQQVELFDLYSDHFLRKSGASKPPQIVLCHGGPGVGKSVVRKYIDEAAAACGRYRLKTSFNAINAIEMGGNTTSSQLALNASHRNYVGGFRYNKKTGDKVKDLRRAGFNKHSLVIVEEISNQAPWHLARLSKLCQETTGNYDDPFGGVLVLLIGDLTQLGPVQAANLTCSVMDINIGEKLRSRLCRKKKDAICKVSIERGDRPELHRFLADHPHRIGSDLFIRCKLFELNQQRRSEDPNHTTFVTKNYRGNFQRKSIQLKDVKQYRILSAADASDLDWVRAPVLVSTNRERQTLTAVRSQHFARATGAVVVRWRTKCKKWRQRPLLECQRNEAMEDPCFYEYFVQGADAFITENIQKSLKLTNATAAVYHSLVLSKEQETELNHQRRNVPPGTVITLSSPPLSVNVEIQMDHSIVDGETRSFLRRRCAMAKVRYTKRKAKHTAVVIPLWPYSCKIDSSETTVKGGKGFLPSKATFQKHFPIEPAFAITIHKSEGRTMKRVIIALSSSKAKGCDFSYAQLHVAFSRVRRADHIRLLLTGANESEQWRSILYLTHLQPKRSIPYFFAGFRSSMERENPNRHWKENQWNKERAEASVSK